MQKREAFSMFLDVENIKKHTTKQTDGRTDRHKEYQELKWNHRMDNTNVIW